MHFQSLLLAAAGLLFASSASGHNQPGSRMARRSSSTSLLTTLNALKYEVAPITYKIESLSKASASASNVTTISSLYTQLADLEKVINATVHTVATLSTTVPSHVNLLDLAHTIVDIVEDVEQALVSLENAVSLDPALSPIITALAGILNGPLASLLSTVTSITSGLLPIVQKLLSSLGIDPILKGLQGVIGTLVNVLL